MHYVVTLNGGKSVCDKVEASDKVRAQGMLVDRDHYLKGLRNSIDGIFEPIYERRIALASAPAPPPQKKKKVEMPIRGACATESLSKRATQAVELLLWRNTLLDPCNRASTLSNKQRAAVHDSPLARAFARSKPSAPC